MKKKNVLLAILVLSNLLFINHIARADTVTLTWDPNQESDLAGYKLFYGQNPRTNGDTPQNNHYTSVINITSRYATTYSLELAPEKYFFSLTAYDESKNESSFSNETTANINSTPGKPGQPILFY